MDRIQCEKERFADILAVIEHADDHQISQVVRAVIRRFAEARPDEEVLFLTLPKNDVEECRRVIMAVLDFFGSGEVWPACGARTADS